MSDYALRLFLDRGARVQFVIEPEAVASSTCNVRSGGSAPSKSISTDSPIRDQPEHIIQSVRCGVRHEPPYIPHLQGLRARPLFQITYTASVDIQMSLVNFAMNMRLWVQQDEGPGFSLYSEELIR